MWVNSTFQLYWCEMWCGKFIPFRHTACGLKYFFFFSTHSVIFRSFNSSGLGAIFWCFFFSIKSFFSIILSTKCWENVAKMIQRCKLFVEFSFPIIYDNVSKKYFALRTKKFPMLINVKKETRIKYLKFLSIKWKNIV